MGQTWRQRQYSDEHGISLSIKLSADLTKHFKLKMISHYADHFLRAFSATGIAFVGQKQ